MLRFSDVVTLVIIMSIFMILLSFVANKSGRIAGLKEGKKSMQTEAIKRGYGVWKAAPDGESVVFFWKDELPEAAK